MIDHLDHLVLTTNHEEACVRFYVELLGMRLETFAQGRKAFAFGNQKINLHMVLSVPCVIAGIEIEVVSIAAKHLGHNILQDHPLIDFQFIK